ncbi:hypothetical protein D3C79_875660 [compost metagenome]
MCCQSRLRKSWMSYDASWKCFRRWPVSLKKEGCTRSSPTAARRPQREVRLVKLHLQRADIARPSSITWKVD